MTDFKFKTGDKLKMVGWDNGSLVEILCVGKNLLFVKDQDGVETTWAKDNKWQLYEPAQESLIGRTFVCEIVHLGVFEKQIKFIREVK